jgi:hypothetical protein
MILIRKSKNNFASRLDIVVDFQINCLLPQLFGGFALTGREREKDSS